VVDRQGDAPGNGRRGQSPSCQSPPSAGTWERDAARTDGGRACCSCDGTDGVCWLRVPVVMELGEECPSCSVDSGRAEVPCQRFPAVGQGGEAMIAEELAAYRAAQRKAAWVLDVLDALPDAPDRPDASPGSGSPGAWDVPDVVASLDEQGRPVVVVGPLIGLSAAGAARVADLLSVLRTRLTDTQAGGTCSAGDANRAPDTGRTTGSTGSAA